MFALDPDIAGQSAQPFWRDTAPHDQSYDRGDDADDHDKFSKLAHDANSCANEAEAQA